MRAQTEEKGAMPPADPTPPGATPATPATPTPAPAPGATPDPAELAKKLSSLESYVEELKAESIGNRQKAKAATATLENLRTALGIEGDAASVDAKVKERVAAQDATIKQLLLERELERAAVRAGLRKPELATKLVDLSDVEVDVSARKITKGDLDAKFTSLKASIPELFGVTPAPAPPTPKPPAGTQDPGTPPPQGATVREQWEAAQKSGDRATTARLWREHGKELGAHALKV